MTPYKTANGLSWRCPNCGYIDTPSTTGHHVVLRQRIHHNEKERIVVVDTSTSNIGSTITRALCPKCGNDQAYVWVIQTRRADEPPTRFFRCTKCGYTWREYD